jgi:hypothetical protein
LYISLQRDEDEVRRALARLGETVGEHQSSSS